jgi:hypothetical protein
MSTAGTLPRAATQTRCAQPVCSATLTTHGEGLMSSPSPLDAMRQVRPERRVKILAQMPGRRTVLP